MDWKQYEKEIYAIFKAEYPKAEISHNIFRLGRYSKTDRQCDVLIEDYVAGNRMTIVVDGKYFQSKVDVKAVDSFVGMLEDIGAHKGLLITKVGFTEAALNRAHYGTSDVELDILNFEDLQQYQGHCAFPFAGKNGVLLPAPFGWVIDARRTGAWLAVMHQQGITLEDAMHSCEFMYINFWDKTKNKESLQDLLEIQKKNLLSDNAAAVIKLLPTIRRDDATVSLREVLVPESTKIEYTGFVEFEDFIFFCVLHTSENVRKKNVRKLENVMSRILKIKVQQ
ncbi:MAG: hypothetical protein C0406_00845 [Sideroxydans sp.]|nr:hypothetical protein [Sideroxydans sp.]